jgi:hypothetical protein
MTDQEIATKAGIVISPCGEEWGGKFAWANSDSLNCMKCGYESFADALEGAFSECCGKDLASICLKSLRDTHKP